MCWFVFIFVICITLIICLIICDYFWIFVFSWLCVWLYLIICLIICVIICDYMFHISTYNAYNQFQKRIFYFLIGWDLLALLSFMSLTPRTHKGSCQYSLLETLELFLTTWPLPFQAITATVNRGLEMVAWCGLWTCGQLDGPVTCNEGFRHI